MRLQDLLTKRRFIVTCQVHLPRDKNPRDYLEEVYGLWGRVDGVRVGSFAADAPISDSLDLCGLLREKRFDPVFHVGTRDQNRLEIQDALIRASTMGVDNVLVFAEDYRITGESLDELMYFHVDTGKFFSVIESLRQGTDVHGKDLESQTDFFVGSGVGADVPEGVPEMGIREMEQLVEKGTRYFLTTPVFDVDEFARFMKRVESLGIPVIAELMMLHTGMHARQLRARGMNVPDRLIERIEKAPVKFDESAKIMLEMIEQLSQVCAGVHILPGTWITKVGPVIQQVKKPRL